MGTSHRHHASVAGEPNWGKASSAVTSLVTAIGEGEKIENNPPQNMTPRAIERKQRSINNRVQNNYRKAVRRLIRAAGGRQAVSSGSSKAIGHAGIALASSWMQTMAEIKEKGLGAWLNEHGVDTLEGKSAHDIFEIITGFIDADITSLDDTAAQAALQYVMGLIEDSMDDVDVEGSLNEIMSGDDVCEYIDMFFGVYVYSHLLQDFSEKIEKDKGSELEETSMDEIRDLIIDDVRRGVNGRSARDIDWSGADGKAFMQEEFDKIIGALTQENTKDED